MRSVTRHLTNVLSVTLGVRLFSMSTIIPFLSVYALNLEGGAPSLTGYALGIYGLSQAALQIPFGMLGDRIGYKKIMLVGLIMLIIGLVVAAYARDIYWLIFARALQGSGAIVTVGYSWISSVVADDHRDRELTRLGAVIGTFTMLSYTVGPLIHIFLDVNEMFLLSAVLVTICFFWVLFNTRQVPPGIRKLHVAQSKPAKSVFNRKNLTLGFMLMVNSLLMMSFFFMIPLLLEGIFKTNQIWIVVTPAILIAISLLPLTSKIAGKGKARHLITFLYLLEGLGFTLIYIRTLPFILAGTVLLMSGYFSISTIVPMLVNKDMDHRQRGKGNGVVVSLQYLGSFLGAAVTGSLWSVSPKFAFLFTGVMTLTGIFMITTWNRQ